MAASLGLAHDTCYAAYPPAAAAASYFLSPPDLVADSAEFPAGTGCYYFPEVVGARTPGSGSGYYASPPAPAVFANGGSAAAADNGVSMMSYAAAVDGDGRRPMSTPAGNGGRPSSRIGFRTRSEVDVLDDGFKWRKYGKKAVKSSPNPRNYYRCSAEGCGVKKRVERDSDDPRYVVTTYDGVHNHAAPGAAHLCPPPPRGATPAAPQGARFSPPCSAASLAPQLVPAPWSATCDAWEAQLHAAAAAVAAHSSESSY